MKPFIQYSIDNHGRVPDNAYLLAQLDIINAYTLVGAGALGPDASDETCSYCLDLLAAHLRERAKE